MELLASHVHNIVSLQNKELKRGKEHESLGFHALDALHIACSEKGNYEHPDFSYEWNNGLLEEVPPADFLSVSLYSWVIRLLEEYFKVFPVGRMMSLKMGFRLAMKDSVSIRIPHPLH